MKTTNKLRFGISAIQSGQKSTTLNALPQLTANSTTGKFVITSPVSKALNLAVGDYVMFFNNINTLENMIQAGSDEIKAFAEELGVDINTREGQDAVVKAGTQWFIGKGFAKLDSKGNPIMTTERFTKEDKAKYLENNRMALVEENRAALVEAFGEMSDEELAEKLTIDMVSAPEVPAYEGAKTSTSAKTTGVGAQLSFTDTAIWGALKADLVEPTKKNRTFDVALDEPYDISVRNGNKDITVKVLPISFVEDTDPIVREKKA